MTALVITTKLSNMTLFLLCQKPLLWNEKKNLEFNKDGYNRFSQYFLTIYNPTCQLCLIQSVFKVKNDIVQSLITVKNAAKLHIWSLKSNTGSSPKKLINWGIKKTNLEYALNCIDGFMSVYDNNGCWRKQVFCLYVVTASWNESLKSVVRRRFTCQRKKE